MEVICYLRLVNVNHGDFGRNRRTPIMKSKQLRAISAYEFGFVAFNRDIRTLSILGMCTNSILELNMHAQRIEISV